MFLVDDDSGDLHSIVWLVVHTCVLPSSGLFVKLFVLVQRGELKQVGVKVTSRVNS